MRILILNWKDIRNPEVGGAEILLYEFAKRLIINGHKVTWFCRKFTGCREFEDINGIKVIRKGDKLTVYFEAWRYFRDSRGEFDKVIDSINTICWQTPLYVSKDKRIAFVNQLAREVFFYELPLPLSYLAYFLEIGEYQTYKSTKFLCYSKSVKEDLVNFGIPAKNIFTFQLGVDHQRYTPSKKSILPLFVFVGRLAKMKRADLCIKAIKIVNERYPQASLAIIGYGPEEDRLQELINKYKLHKNVSIVGKDNLFFEKNNKDMKVKLMQEAWALLMPSVKEGWGMVVTEAAACGTPAIVTDVTGLRDSVINKKTGLVISPYPTAAELSNVLFKIIEDDKLRSELSRSAINWAGEFSWEKSYKQFIELLIK